MTKGHKKSITKTGKKGVLKKKNGLSNLNSVDRLHELEELDNVKKNKDRRHVLAVRVKRSVKKSVPAVTRLSEEEAAEMLDREQARLREEIQAANAPRVVQPVVNKTEKDKRLMMWSGVIFCMLVITIVWIINIKETLKQATAQNNNQALEEWNKTTDQLAEQMNKIKDSLDKIESFSASSTGPVATTAPEQEIITGATLPEAQNISEQDMAELKEKITNIATTTELRIKN